MSQSSGSDRTTTDLPAEHSEPDVLVLAGEFEAPTRDEWLALVDGIVGKTATEGDHLGWGAERLSHTRYDGFDVAPLYTAADEASEPGLPGSAPFVRGSSVGGAAGTGWDVRQYHADPDADVTRKEVLADLEHGVSSLWFGLGGTRLAVSELAGVLTDVHLDLAGVVLDAGPETEQAARTLIELVAERGARPEDVRGSLGADPVGLLARTGDAPELTSVLPLVEAASHLPQLRTITVDALPFHDAGGSDAQELGGALAAGLAYLRTLVDAGLSVDEACGRLEFRFAATADQFATIAKLRAARRTWGRVALASGASETAAAQLQHAVTSSAMLTRRDPWVNMLRTTVSAFAAGVGGAAAVTVQPFDAALGHPDAFGRRIARNTHALLIEESHVAQVIDPAGGSWYVENLSDELARAAWEWFQQIEREGGIETALRSGLIGDRIAETWEVRRRNIARRKDPITGVSEFADLDEKPVVRKPVSLPGESPGGLPRVRYADPFEAFRDASDAALSANGSRPTVLLATLGPLAAYTARAGFARNLLSAGGVSTPEIGATEEVSEVVAGFRESGAKAVCLCSTDKLYEERAAETVAALREAGASWVLVAGRLADPPPGVDGFLYLGCDAVEAIAQVYRVLGVSA